MQIIVKGDNLVGIMRGIIRNVIENSSGLLDRIGEKVVLVSIKKNFEEEGRPDKWEPLKERTQRERRAEGYDPEHPILVRSGELKRSATTKEGMNYQLEKKQLIMDCFLRKAERLHFGDIGLVARPFFFLQDQDTGLAEKEAKVYFEKEKQKIINANKLTGIEEMLS